MKTVMKIGRGFWKSVVGAGVSVFNEGMLVGNFCNRREFKMKKLLIGLVIGLALTAINIRVTYSSEWGGSLYTGLIGYWNFDTMTDSNTKFPDVYLGNYNGTVVNSTYVATWEVNASCKIGRCVYFNNEGWSFGIDSYIDLGDTSSFLATNKPVTISFWAYPINNSRGNYMGTSDQTDDEKNPQFAIGKEEESPSDRPVRFRMKDSAGGRILINENAVNNYVNSWLHYVVVYSGNKDATGVKIYINGTLISNDVKANTLTGDVSFADFTFGSMKGIYGSKYRLDEVGIWNRSLTSAEVTQLYNDGGGITYVTPTPTPTPTITPTPTPTKSMDSHGPPSAGSGMYSLSQIYDYVNSGIEATPVPSFQEPGAPPGPTMRTTKEIYDKIHGNLSQSEETAADVRSGVKFFCTQPGSWGIQTGTRP
ncbi:MAG: LamG domain-containing protein [Candidatus Aureabacteria bacterium]|nr:LamG domain-containing protein [Candidatus Auribacterota bacterium]